MHGRTKQRSSQPKPPRIEVLEDRTLLSATHLVFLQQPKSTVAGGAFSPPVQVAVEDSSNQIVSSAAGAVSIAIQHNPSGGTLSGTTGMNLSQGKAAFGDLSINQAGTGCTLVASDPALGSPLGLSIAGVPGEIVVESYTWGETNPGQGPASLNDFTLAVDPSTADPGFLAAVASD
jgi:hypothetical protein